MKLIYFPDGWRDLPLVSGTIFCWLEIWLERKWKQKISRNWHVLECSKVLMSSHNLQSTCKLFQGDLCSSSHQNLYIAASHPRRVLCFHYLLGCIFVKHFPHLPSSSGTLPLHPLAFPIQNPKQYNVFYLWFMEFSLLLLLLLNPWAMWVNLQNSQKLISHSLHVRVVRSTFWLPFPSLLL